MKVNCVYWSPEEKLIAAIFEIEKRGLDYHFPLCYPYIVIEKNGQKRRLTLKDALEEVLEILPLTQGKDDKQEWPRYKKLLELRYGLKDGKWRTHREVSQEFRVIGEETVSKIEDCALKILKHNQIHSERLKKFLIPKELQEIKIIKEKLIELEKENHRLKEENKNLNEFLDKIGLSEKYRKEYFSKLNPHTYIPLIRRALLDAAIFEELISNFPNSMVWNRILEHGNRKDPAILKISQLRQMTQSGQIKSVKGIGEKGASFLKEILAK